VAALGEPARPAKEVDGAPVAHAEDPEGFAGHGAQCYCQTQGVYADRIVFVGGLHRSGTSLLAHALARHPAVSGFRDTGAPEDEGQHLQSVYPIAKVHGGPGKFGFDPASHLTEDSPLVTAENRARMLEEWSRHWDLDREVLLEKSPPNLLKTRFLQALFPGARFVMIVRHPIPVALATARWRETRGLHRLIRHWLVCHERFAADRPKLARVHVVRYENLVRDPAATLADVLGFLGLEGKPPPVEVDPGPNVRYLERWEELKRELLMRVYLGLTELRYERRVRRFAYSLRSPYEAPRRSS
jgi:hypothetical protein